MTAFGITLLIGIGLGVAVGIPMGRFLERVRPSRDEDGRSSAKKRRRR